MSLKRRKAGLGFTSWQRSFSILAPWRKGKGDMVLDSEVVLTKMKVFQNFSEKLLVSEDSFSTSSCSVSVCEQEASEPNRTSKENPRVDEGPGSPSEEAAPNYLCAIFSDSQLPRLYKFESEDSGVELPSGTNSPSTPTGSEQSFVVHSRESSCDSCRLKASAPVSDERVSSSTAGESEEKLTTDADGEDVCEDVGDTVGDTVVDNVVDNVVDDIVHDVSSTFGDDVCNDVVDNVGSNNGDDVEDIGDDVEDIGSDLEDTLLQSTMTEEGLGFCMELTDVTVVEDPVEACCGDVLERSPDSVVHVGTSEPEAAVEEEEEEERPSEQPNTELEEGKEEEDVFHPLTSVLRKSSTSDSLEDYMDECCRLSEAGSNTPLGSGLGYLEHICRLIEKIGHLQETNLRLQKQICGVQKTSRAAKTREEFFQHHCTCGAAGLAHQETPKRLQRNDFLSLSGTLSDLSTIHEVTRRPPLSDGNGRALGPVPLWRRGQNRRSYTEGETRFLCDGGAEGGAPVPQRRLSENYTWGRVKDLVRRAKLRNSSSSKLGLSPTSLKMSCPQLYRPDLGPVELPRSRNRNSMITLGQQDQLDLSWLQ